MSDTFVAAGPDGTEHIDVAATALTVETTVTELRNADPAYAPAFSPVWGPPLTATDVHGRAVAAE
jgi:hypothetical protein